MRTLIGVLAGIASAHHDAEWSDSNGKEQE